MGIIDARSVNGMTVVVIIVVAAVAVVAAVGFAAERDERFVLRLLLHPYLHGERYLYY